MTVSKCAFLLWKALAFLATTLLGGAGVAAVWLNPRPDLAYHVMNTGLIFAAWFVVMWMIGCLAVWYPPRGTARESEGFLAGTESGGPG